MNYKRDIKIDETALDIEWLEQAELAIRYGEYWNECDDEVSRAEEHVKDVYAELTIEINQNPEKYLGVDKKGEPVKPTDEKVKAAVRIHPDHKAAIERLLDAKKAAADAKIVHGEISFTRKTALENLVILHGQNYFAGPKMPRDISKERVNYAQERANMSKNLPKRTRKT